MNPNTEFEQFTQRIYQKLVNNDVLKPTIVQHNVKLKGKSGCEHQIDVYWEYEIAGNKHCVAIECKNYDSLVPIGKVRDFQSVLSDLNNVNGMMISKKGFQEGAKKFAKEYGMALKVLTKPVEDEIIGDILIKTHADIRRYLILVDDEWASQNGLNFQKYREKMAFIANKSPEEYWKGPHVSFETKDDVIRNSQGEKITNLEQLGNQVYAGLGPNSSHIIKYEDAWIDSRYWGPIKIKEVKFEHETDDQESIIDLYADQFVDGILKDAISGETDYVPKY